MFKDIVCGMDLNQKTARYISFYKGKTHYFCGKTCKLQFDDNPEKYLKQAPIILNK